MKKKTFHGKEHEFFLILFQQQRKSFAFWFDVTCQHWEKITLRFRSGQTFRLCKSEESLITVSSLLIINVITPFFNVMSFHYVGEHCSL